MEGRYSTRNMWTYLTVHLSQDSSKTRAQPSVSCTSYDEGSGRKLGSLELYELTYPVPVTMLPSKVIL